MSLALLSQLWLHEPDADLVERSAHDLGLPAADPRILAQAYADTLLLNIYPYRDVFLDPSGELNSPRSEQLAAAFRAHGYDPPELLEVAAPDHIGLCLGFMAHTPASGAELIDWAPVCCLAVEYEPGVHPFYRALGKATRAALFAHATHIPLTVLPDTDPPQRLEDSSLHDIVRHVLTPACSGAFLSRSRLGHIAKSVGAAVPFGARFDVAQALFAAADQSNNVPALIDGLDAEIRSWASRYEALAPRWHATAWLTRTTATSRLFARMRSDVSKAP